MGVARDQGNSRSREARVGVLKVVCDVSLFSRSILCRPQVSLLPRSVPSAAKPAVSAKGEKTFNPSAKRGQICNRCLARQNMQHVPNEGKHVTRT